MRPLPALEDREELTSVVWDHSHDRPRIRVGAAEKAKLIREEKHFECGTRLAIWPDTRSGYARRGSGDRNLEK